MPSRQALYQTRKRQEGNCIVCGKPRDPTSANYCTAHLAKARVRIRESMRRATSAVKRNYGAISYRDSD